jgi:hypothetical protein
MWAQAAPVEVVAATLTPIFAMMTLEKFENIVNNKYSKPIKAS